MIVVSGVLVLVALVFLIIGLFGEGLTFIWASIGTSVVAGVFLLLGALQRRGTPAAATDSGTTSPDTMERVTAVSVRPREEAADEASADTAAVAADTSGGGDVSVVPGRPRYHVAGCRFLAGRSDVETTSVDDARGEGYTACGVCKPDQALAASSAASTASAPVDEPADEPVEDTMTDQVATDDATSDDTTVIPAPARARKAPAKKAAAATKSTATTATTATRATKATAGTATKAAKPAAKAAAGTSTVVAVPDRGKFHTATCRFSSAPGALEMTKTAAKRQGLAACGVCKP